MLKSIHSFKALPAPTPVRLHEWSQDTIPLVTIRCITYNHEAFIRQCIEGFLMQETDFPVEILIHDDASDDNTATIIRKYQEKYPQLIRAILQTENQYSKGKSIRFLLNEMSRGAYIALCEGDDYWTDSRKLQKQVDLMDAHPSYSMCGSLVRCIMTKADGSEEEIPNFIQSFDTREVLKLEDFVSRYQVHTSTALYRRKFYQYPESFNNIANPDVCTFALLAEKGDVGFIREFTSAYRIHPGGVYSGKSQLQKLRGFQNTCNHLNGYFKGQYVHHLRRWEHGEARKTWTEFWQDHKCLDAMLLYIELYPRYARHVTLLPWMKDRFAAAITHAREIWVRFRMRVGLRTRIWKLFRL